MVASIEMAEEMGVIVLILGDMYELGVFENAGHRDVLQAALSSSARLICCVGARFRAVITEASATSEANRVLSVLTAAEVVETVLPRLHREETILLKGSRAIALERVIEDLTAGGVSRA